MPRQMETCRYTRFNACGENRDGSQHAGSAIDESRQRGHARCHQEDTKIEIAAESNGAEENEDAQERGGVSPPVIQTEPQS